MRMPRMSSAGRCRTFSNVTVKGKGGLTVSGLLAMLAAAHDVQPSEVVIDIGT